MTDFEDFDLKNEWNLWYHELNDNNWNIDSYQNILNLKKYSDVLFMIKSYENITDVRPETQLTNYTGDIVYTSK